MNANAIVLCNINDLCGEVRDLLVDAAITITTALPRKASSELRW